jgi:hypothetical protein
VVHHEVGLCTKYLVEIYNIDINFLMVHVNVSRRNSYRVNIVTNFIQKVRARIKKDLTCILYRKVHMD